MRSASASRSPGLAEPLHERSNAARMLRLCAVRANLPPLSWALAGVYRAAALAAERALRREQIASLEAVYLRGSAAIDEVVPGLSDLDFFLVLRDEVDPASHEELGRWWRGLAARNPLLEPDPWILRREELERLHRENPAVRFHLLEAREAWRLVLGHDLAAEIAAPDAPAVAQALIGDLELRLTYFNGLTFAAEHADRLQDARTEHLLYKLTLDLVRTVLYLRDGEVLLHRGRVASRFQSGEPGPSEWLGIGGDTVLRAFVAHTRRYRLRRSFLRPAGLHLDDLQARLLDLALAVLDRAYADPGFATLPVVAVEHEHFYDGDLFRPTGSRFHLVDHRPGRPFAALRREVSDRLAEGVHTVVRTERLWANLANREPALGNCTVVRAPADREIRGLHEIDQIERRR